MARRRTVGDEAVLDGTGRVLARLGPTRLTLGDVAAEVGLAPATLLQRFGSKRGLLLAYAERASAGLEAEFRAARASTASPLEALQFALVGLSRNLATPEALANSLAFYHLDISDPEFRRHALEHARSMRGEIRALLEDATAGGEVRPCDTADLARAVQVTYNGALTTWALEREGTLADWLGESLERLFRPLRRERPAATAGGDG